MNRFVGEVIEDDNVPDCVAERRARIADDAERCAWQEMGSGDDGSVVQTELMRFGLGGFV